MKRKDHIRKNREASVLDQAIRGELDVDPRRTRS